LTAFGAAAETSVSGLATATDGTGEIEVIPPLSTRAACLVPLGWG
jgi:hypothetical protein